MRQWVVIAFALMVALFSPLRPVHAQPALVFDLDSGQVLIANEAGRRWYPASLTKLMTAYLTFQAIKSGKLSFSSRVKISRNAANGGGRGAARLGVKPGTELSVDYMLLSLLVRSDADMAVALAEAVGGSEKNFVKMMNRTARRLGMTATHFVNPHGMGHPGQVTTARDMGMLAMGLYHHFLKRNPSWWRYFSTPYIRSGKRKRKNRNHLLFMMKGANGMKTGFICASGFNLLATARRNGRLLAAVVLGRKTAHTRASFARIMLEEGFRRLGAGIKGGVFLPQIRNSPAAPPDISADICKGRTIRMAEFSAPEAARGWAVAIGGYRASVNAEAALEAELLAAGLWGRELPFGVARLPEEKKYAGLAWGLNESYATSLCVRARAHRVPCKMYPPQAFSQLAALIAEDRARRKALEEERKKRKARRKARGGKKIRKRRGNFASRRKHAANPR